jgi:hypothetical protein
VPHSLRALAAVVAGCVMVVMLNKISLVNAIAFVLVSDFE